MPPLAPVVLAYQIGYLSNFIPVPGGIGVLDGSMIGMLVLYGLGGTVATAATLAYHAISLWVPALWGTIAFIAVQKTKRQPLVLSGPAVEVRAEPR
ncbi:MAG TPA: lysylphosphatidylglycerol synthase domain-containing protein [Solirubrobacteraceae bacterium]|nr:lysylphosphatidylglycerol synthase domain-containing protein [Solirubrobacteraceae bacterium]